MLYEKMDYFYILHLKEAFIEKCCIWFLRSWTHFSCGHKVTHTYFLVLKHTTQNTSIIWEEAVHNLTQSSSLQLFCIIITKLCHKIS